MLQGIFQSLALELQPTLLECSAQLWLFCCFLFSRSSRQLGAEIGQSARAVCPFGVSKTGAGSLHGFSLSNARTTMLNGGRGGACSARVEAFLQVVWFVILALVCVCVRECVCRELVKLWQQLSILWVAQFMRTLCVAQVVTRRRTGAAFGVATLCNVRMCAGGGGVRSAWRWQVRVAPDSSGSCDDDDADWFNRFGAEQLAKSQAL